MNNRNRRKFYFRLVTQIGSRVMSPSAHSIAPRQLLAHKASNRLVEPKLSRAARNELNARPTRVALVDLSATTTTARLSRRTQQAYTNKAEPVQTRQTRDDHKALLFDTFWQPNLVNTYCISKQNNTMHLSLRQVPG